MFEISWSELLILGVVTLIFVGPRDLPKFLGALGRYAGVVRRHAQDFRRQFDEAMREAELADLKREVESVREDVAGTLREAERGMSAPSLEPREAERKSAQGERASVATAAAALDAPSEGSPPAAGGAEGGR